MMRLLIIFFLITVFPGFSLTTREERRARFEERSRQRGLEESSSIIDQLNGLFFFGNVGGATFQSFDSNYSYDRQGFVASDAHFDPRSSLDITWNVGLGWLFYGYASLDASYQYSNLAFSTYVHPTDIESNDVIYTQQGYGNVDLQLATLSVKLLLPKILGAKQPRVAPFVGGGLGYVHKRLESISLYDNGPVTSQDQTKTLARGGFAYKILAGWYFLLQEHLLMNVECNYLHMGAVRAKNSFTRKDGESSLGEFSFISAPRVKLRSLAFTLGFTIVI